MELKGTNNRYIILNSMEYVSENPLGNWKSQCLSYIDVEVC